MDLKGDQAGTGMTETIGRPARLREPIEPAPHIPDYQCFKVIGRGAFGTVWLAEETMAGVYRAIKILRPRREPSPAAAAIGPDPAAPDDSHTPRHADGPARHSGRSSLVNRELDGIHAYQVSAGDHPHLIRILKTGTCKIADDSAAGGDAAAGRLRTAVYYVMEIADHAGGAQPHHAMDYQPLSLATLLRQRGRLPGAEVVKLAGELLSAIEHLHKAGLHHRDVKPSNVLFVNGVLKLADLGLAALDGASEHVGTPGYLPPPAAGGDPAQRHGPPSDLYALGKVLYELTTGLPAARFPEWPGDLDPASDPLLPPLRGLINALCHPAAAARLSGLAEVRQRLRSMAAPGRRISLNRRRLAVAAGVLVLLALAGLRGALWWAAGTEATDRQRTDPMERRFARPPYDGTKEFASLEVGGCRYELLRRFRPDLPISLNNGNQVCVSFDDLEAHLGDAECYLPVGLAAEQPDRFMSAPSLIVAGRFHIWNTTNPLSNDVTNPRGEIDQLYLVIGEGYAARYLLLYHGQPGASPGVRGRFLRSIPLVDPLAGPAGDALVLTPQAIREHLALPAWDQSFAPVEYLRLRPRGHLDIRFLVRSACTPQQAERELMMHWDTYKQFGVFVGTIRCTPQPPPGVSDDTSR